jgi:hypothetical protein
MIYSIFMRNFAEFSFLQRCLGKFVKNFHFSRGLLAAYILRHKLTYEWNKSWYMRPNLLIVSRLMQINYHQINFFSIFINHLLRVKTFCRCSWRYSRTINLFYNCLRRSHKRVKASEAKLHHKHNSTSTWSSCVCASVQTLVCYLVSVLKHLVTNAGATEKITFWYIKFVQCSRKKQKGSSGNESFQINLPDILVGHIGKWISAKS